MAGGGLNGTGWRRWVIWRFCTFSFFFLLPFCSRRRRYEVAEKKAHGTLAKASKYRLSPRRFILRDTEKKWIVTTRNQDGLISGRDVQVNDGNNYNIWIVFRCCILNWKGVCVKNIMKWLMLTSTCRWIKHKQTGDPFIRRWLWWSAASGKVEGTMNFNIDFIQALNKVNEMRFYDSPNS